ncbi:DNRLRE domain-containing protein [Paenibacillus popilliae]|uniref:DNRLRE domain-containing protein n=1 Tax=Paenibacillus popilliae TaxID=78057 RepID=A0ABY3AY22_PAEPP|nr:DNRLRE domain-containing protein [Paenibacillus sp. SDF0028]TQR46763.1 DNRLRE domain-containing protein [Paenibacillus sp. SDF0028]
MYRIVEQTQAQMQQGYFSNSDIYVDTYGKLTLVNHNLQTNLALHKPYTKTNNAKLTTSDEQNKMFTDGIRDKWFRYDSTSLEELVIDLGVPQPIGGASFFVGSSVASTPHYVEVLGSIDSVTFSSLAIDGEGKNRTLSFNHSFESHIARYVKFKLIRSDSYPITVSEGEVYAGVTYTGYREQTYDISSIGKLRTNHAYWLEETPLGTSVTIETSVSLDGGSTWTGWKPLKNGGTLQNITLGTDISNGRLKIRVTLTTGNINVPSFYNFNLYIDDVFKYDENNIVIPKDSYSLKRITPDMTSAISPAPYEINAIGTYNGDSHPWKAFDGKTESNDPIDAWRYKSSDPSTITIDLGENNNRSICGYKLHRIEAYYPVDWKLEGSIDNSNWILLDNVRNATYEKVICSRNLDINKLESKINYRFYRLSITKSNYQNFAYVAEMQLFLLDDSYGYQVQSSILVPFSSSFPCSIDIPPNNQATGAVRILPIITYALPSSINVKIHENMTCRINVPINNRATGSVRILPIINYVMPSTLNVKIHDNLACRINVPINNRAQAIISIVKQPTKVVSLTPVKDAFVRKSIPKLNYGTEQDMYAGYNTDFNELYRSFVSFDLSSIPPDQTIKSARLSIYHEADTGPNQIVNLYQLDREWTERGITWDNQPLPTEKIAEIDVGSISGYQSVDFTNVVIDWYSGNKANNGFILQMADESEKFFKRFYARESHNTPKLEIEYADKTVYTFGRADVKNCRIIVRRAENKDIVSKLNVKQIWFDHAISCRLKVAVMGTIDSHMAVKNPNLGSYITVRREEDSDLNGHLVVRCKGLALISCMTHISQPRLKARIRVRRTEQLSIPSKIRIRVEGKSSLLSRITVNRKFIFGRLTVVKSASLPCRIGIVATDKKQAHGKLIVRRTENKGIRSLVRVVEKAVLRSSIFVLSGDLPCQIRVPYQKYMDHPSRIKVRAKMAGDMNSRIRIGDPFEDSEGYIYIM